MLNLDLQNRIVVMAAQGRHELRSAGYRESGPAP